MEKDKSLLLWVDLTVHGSCFESLSACIADLCEVRRVGTGRATPEKIGQRPLQILCFEYDHPDIAGLQLLQKIKRDQPDIPILMLTEQHSEALATWALRVRVWDYLIKPIAAAELTRSVASACRLLQERPSHERRRVYAPEQLLPLDTFVPPEARFRKLNDDARAIYPAVSYVESHYHVKIAERTVAALCGMNPFRFSRAFKKAMGTTFQEFLIRYRITEATRILRNPNASITDVAYSIGFNDPSHFTRLFKRYTGLSPSDYRTHSRHGKAADPDPTSRQQGLNMIDAPRGAAARLLEYAEPESEAHAAPPERITTKLPS